MRVRAAGSGRMCDKSHLIITINLCESASDTIIVSNKRVADGGKTNDAG